MKMQIARTAPILFLIALSGCSEKPEASDPPAIGLSAEPDIQMATDDSSIDQQAVGVEAPAEAPSETRMQSPVQYD
jgi:hypothetical protein